MADLSHFELSDVLSLGSSLRRFATGCDSMEAAAKRVVDLLYRELAGSANNDPALVLARLYKTHRYGDLDEGLQTFARDILGRADTPAHTKCLVLLATRGSEEAWNDRHRSAGHQAIPLPDPEFVAKIPMVTEVFRQLGVDVRTVLQDNPGEAASMSERRFDVFLVEHAKGSPYIPAQDFVERHGVASVLAFGGGLPDGDLFVTLLFSKVPISREVADMFGPLGLSAKLALLPHVGHRLVEEGARR